jgi:hypothetical protein
MTRRPRWRLNQQRRLGQGDVNQALDHLAWPGDINVKAAQQDKSEPKLNENDRGERISALPRPHR